MQDSIAVSQSDSIFVNADSILFETGIGIYLSNEKSEGTNDFSSHFDFNKPVIILPDTVKKEYVNTLFVTHQLPLRNSYPPTYFKHTPDWFTFILILVVIALTGLRTFYSKIFNQLLKAFFNDTVANQMVRDQNLLVQRASITLSIISYFSVALLLYKISDFYKYDNILLGEGLLRFLFFALFVSLIYSVKMIILKIFGFIFKADKPVSSYIFTIFLCNNVLGVILIPFLIIMAYSQLPFIHYFYYISIAFFIIILFYRWIKGFVIGLSIPGFSILYIIFYLCALEIAPLLVIAKLATL